MLGDCMKFYFTFEFCSPHKGKYVSIEANSWHDAHNIMIQRYESYQYQYTEEEFSKILTQVQFELLDSINEM